MKTDTGNETETRAGLEKTIRVRVPASWPAILAQRELTASGSANVSTQIRRILARAIKKA